MTGLHGYLRIRAGWDLAGVRKVLEGGGGVHRRGGGGSAAPTPTAAARGLVVLPVLMKNYIKK